METKTQNLTPNHSKLGTGQVTRPPVVVVLGHVDSGKTSILDYIRKTQVAEKESGGITQHIGAYQIEKEGKKITFIDTPGHEAFSAMRSRGAKVADIAVLVVDTTQGVQAQTKEAILQVKTAKIPIIVALNKVDRPEVNLEKTKKGLAQEDVLVESLGGKIPEVLTSAKTGQGIEELLEIILLMAEMEELKADLSKLAEGVVIESYLDNQRGPTATLLLSEGVLKLGDIIATQSTLGKVRYLENFQGNAIDKALPAEPVIIIGFENAPRLGENFKVFPSIEDAKNHLKLREKEKIPEASKAGPEQKVLNLILKTDVLGSIEAIEEVLKGLPQEKIVLRILRSQVGQINETDIKFAKAYPAFGHSAVILGFRVKPSPVAESLAEREKVKIMTFEIIYDLVEEVRKFMEKILEPEEIKVELAKIKTLAIFLAEKNRQIIGGKVIEGEVKKGTQIEVFRLDTLIGKGRLVNLQRDKKDVDKVIKGQDCGILFEGDTKIEEGDILVVYTEERRKSEL